MNVRKKIEGMKREERSKERGKIEKREREKQDKTNREEEEREKKQRDIRKRERRERSNQSEAVGIFLNESGQKKEKPFGHKNFKYN